MSQRTEQIESLLKRAISQVLQRQVSDPRIAGLVSITRVNVSPDLREAQVYVSILPEQYEKRTLAGLRHAAGHIRSLARKLVDLRTMPTLDFRLDETLKKTAQVHEAIRQGMARTGEAPPQDEDERQDDPQDQPRHEPQ